MKASLAGIDLIKRFEGVRLKAYRCPARILTIGYGHTGPDVTEGLVIDQAKADALLRQDLDRFEKAVTLHAGAATQPQFDAMVSLAFNIGVAAFARSTLAHRHRSRQHAAAADEFLRWNRAGGRVLAGLERRRAAERALYLSA